MVLPGLRKWAAWRGWTVDRNCVYGDYDGYLFTAFDGQGNKSFATFLPGLTEEQRLRLTAYLRENRRQLRLAEFKLNGAVLVLRLREAFLSASIDAMEGLLGPVTGFLKAEGIAGGDRCALCGQAVKTEAYFVNDVAAGLCGACAQQVQTAVDRKESEERESEKNYGAGLAGALLGGMVAAVPWVLVATYLGLMVAFLGYLIGAAALKGYYLCRGRLGPGTKWIVGGAVIFCVFAAEIATISIALIQAGVPASTENLMLLMTMPGFAGTFWKDVVLGWVLALLGIAPLFRKISEDLTGGLPRIRRAEL